MHSVLSNKTCVRLLKCVYYGLNRNQTGYAYRKLRFCSNHNVLATAAVQEDWLFYLFDKYIFRVFS